MINRRQFISKSAQAFVGLLFAKSTRWLHAAIPSGGDSAALDFSVPVSGTLPQMVIARGSSPGKIVTDALEAIGGIGRFIAKGDRVLIKPNVSWDCEPELGADTHPEIVKAVTELCLKAGARRVVVMDNTIDEPRRCFAVSGIGKAVKDAGGSIRHQGERTFRDIEVGGSVGKWPVMVPLFEADKFINIPVVKSHGLSGLTAAMKNLYGVVGGRRGKLHAQIDDSIATLARFVRPTLVVLDAFRVMVTNGPSGGREADLIHPRTVAVGTDQVALDAFAATVIGRTPKEIGHVRLAHERGLGNMRYRELRIKEIKVA